MEFQNSYEFMKYIVIIVAFYAIMYFAYQGAKEVGKTLGKITFVKEVNTYEQVHVS